MKFLVFVVVFWMLASPGYAGTDNRVEQDSVFKVNVSYNSILKLPTGTPSEILSYDDDPLQYGELWLPDTEQNLAAPLIVFIHGGCWLNAYDIKHTQAASNALTKAGYAVLSVEYRRTGDEGGAWPGTFNDILSAIEFAKRLKRDKVNNSQIILMGHSAGGHLALLAANHYGKHEKNSVKGVIGLAAISNLKKYSQGDNSCQSVVVDFMNGDFKANEEQYNLADPMVQGFHSRTILIHGDSDTIVPLAQSTKSNQYVEIVQGAGHFDMIHTGSSSWQVMLKILGELNRSNL